MKSHPQSAKCLRSATDYALLKIYACACLLHYYAVFENPLLQAWDLIFDCSCVIRLHWSPAQEDLVSLLYSQTLPYNLVRAHLLTLLRSCLCHKPSTWLLLIITPTRLRLIHTHACFVITFLIWKFGGWIEVLTPTLRWLVITFLFWKTSGWIEDICWLIYEPFLTWNTFHFRGKEEKCHNKTQIIPPWTTGYPIGTCLDWRTRVQTTFAHHNVTSQTFQPLFNMSSQARWVEKIKELLMPCKLTDGTL